MTTRMIRKPVPVPDRQPLDVEVDCLLPTGLLIPIKCRSSITLDELKTTLWDEAKKLPLFDVLHEPGRYVFVYVTCNAEQEECLDETVQLADIPLYKEVFKLVERKGDKEEKVLNARISNLINKRLGDFDSLRDSEVNDFRAEMVDKCRGAIDGRAKAQWKDKAMYLYSPDIEAPLVNGILPDIVKRHLNPNGKFCIYVQVQALEKKDQMHQFAFSVDPIELADEFLIRVLSKKQKTLGLSSVPNREEFALKVCGVYEYLLCDYPMIQYSYIYKQVCKGQNPFLALIHYSTILNNVAPEKFTQPVLVKKSDPNIPNAQSLWNIKDKYSVKAIRAGNLNIQKDVNVKLYAGIYHGSESLCEVVMTASKTQTEQDGIKIWTWNENLEFDICTCDLPQGARLCLVIYEVFEEKGRLRRKKREEKVPLAWVNVALIDYKSRLRCGEKKLYCWPTGTSFEEELNPIGGIMTNPDTHDAPFLILKFRDYNQTPVVYPSMDVVLETASREMGATFTQDMNSQNKVITGLFREVVERDPLHPLFEQEKELLWRMRFKCQEEPHTLSKLLNAVKWANHKDVAQFLSMLQVWKELNPEHALELLDYVYPDVRVRSFAVKCLRNVTDTELSMYLIQLVQGLKYELYLNCELVDFLLERAWANQKIGHYLFWHLRAEMDNPEVSLRFGLILEAYCRGSTTHMDNLQRQVDAVGRLKDVSEGLQGIKHIKEKEQKRAAREKMRGHLRDENCRIALNNLQCTLMPKLKLGQLQVDKCRFFDSKMRPLLLVYDNEDISLRLSQNQEPSPYTEIKIIFKSGDDLRQDMLTLQIFGVMDRLWQAEGLDFRMYHYGCLATGTGNGYIEVVQKAETIANIQKTLSGSGPKLTWDNRLLHAWLKEKNPDPQQLQKAEETFCLSCAGSCVATYVLGIGDRHSDNIMVTDRGQLCHIDFGHFLGNFKSKFGVRRERVPFVLASDFEIIIAREHFGFKKFQQLCEKAFMILRKKGGLFINLLAIMLSTGIPELRSVEDLNYVRDALYLVGTENEALEHFRKKMSEARNNAWSTSLNWYIHGLAKDNTK